MYGLKRRNDNWIEVFNSKKQTSVNGLFKKAKHIEVYHISSFYEKASLSYLPTPPLVQDMTQGQFLSGV